MNYGTLPSRLLTALDSHPNPRAQLFRRGEVWEAISSTEFLRRIAGLSTAFVELGVKPGERVGLFSTNRPEWHTADFAASGAEDGFSGESSRLEFPIQRLLGRSVGETAYRSCASRAKVKRCLARGRTTDPRRNVTSPAAIVPTPEV